MGAEEGESGDLEVSKHSAGYPCLRASGNYEPVGDAHLEMPFSHEPVPCWLVSAFTPPPLGPIP